MSAAFGAAAWLLERRLRDARDDLRNCRDLIDNLSEGIYRSHPDGTQISANRALVALNGYRDEAEQLAGVTDIGAEWYVEPDRRDEFRRILSEQGRVEDFVSEIYRHKTRERIWISENARVVRHRKTGQPLFYEGSVREVTETVRRLGLEERFRKLTHLLPGALFQVEIPRDAAPRVAYISPGIASLTGHSHADHMAHAGLFNSLIDPADTERYARSAEDAEATLSHWEVEFRIRTKDGAKKWLRMSAMPELSHNTLTWHGYVADISVRKRHEVEIETLAFFDPLTRLPNRRLLMQTLEERTGGRAPDDQAPGDGRRPGALLFIDLDNFKSLNDTHGHGVGDKYLVQVAARLKAAVAPGDLVARIGGDEFVVIAAPGQPDEASAQSAALATAESVVASLREPFRFGALEHTGSASVGVVAFSGRDAADEVIKRADVAMYQAKAAGRNGTALFDPTTLNRETRRYRLIQDLQTAIAEDQFLFLFQPRYDDERRLTGAEALLRWAHPRGEQLGPDSFLELAEQFGTNAGLGRLVLHKVCAALAQWQADPLTADLRVSLKMGARCFTGERFLGFLDEAVFVHGADVSRLTLELSEGVVGGDIAPVAARMETLKARGVRFLLDGFGRGHASLPHLRALPFDEIKIDGAFVAEIDRADQDRSLVRTVLAMARMLRLETVAEGIAHIRQESFLRAFGCQRFQGPLYAEPMEADLFRLFVARHAIGSMTQSLEERGRLAG